MSLLIQSNRKSYVRNDKDVFNIQNSITDGNMLVMKSYVITCDIPNINKYNNKLFVDDGSQSFPVSLASGRYSFVELAVAVESALNLTGSAIYTVTWLNGVYTVNSSIPISYGNLNPLGKSVWEMMGIKLNVFSSISGGGAVNIHATDYLNVSSFELSRFKNYNDVGTSNSSNVLGSVRYNDGDVILDPTSLTAPETVRPKILSGEFNNFKNIKLSAKQTLSNLDISVTDDFGNSYNEFVSYSLEFLIL